MKRKTLKSYLEKWTPQLKTTIKDVYNLINDVRVFSFDEIEVNEEEFNKLIELTQKVNMGEDITFEIGYRYFRNNKIKLKKGVFVPQYDTEQIIDIVKSKVTQGRFVEIGTGSGAIPISLSNETEMSGISLDINPEATNLARENYQGDKVEFITEDYFNWKSEEKFDLLISNPPYIKEDDQFVDDWVKENQPTEALYAKEEGLAFYKSFFLRVSEILKDKGYIIIEIGYDQAEQVKELASEVLDELEVVKDYEQHDRFIVGRYHEK